MFRPNSKPEELQSTLDTSYCFSWPRVPLPFIFLNWCVAMDWKLTSIVLRKGNWISLLDRVLPICMRCSKLVKFVRYPGWKTLTHHLPRHNSLGNQFRMSDILCPRVTLFNDSQGSNSYCTFLLSQCSMWWIFGRIPSWSIRLTRQFPDTNGLSLCPVLQQIHLNSHSRSYRAEVPCRVLNVPAYIIHHLQITCSPSTLLVTVSALAMQSTPLILFIEGLICTAGHHFVYSPLSLLPLMKTMKNLK